MTKELKKYIEAELKASIDLELEKIISELNDLGHCLNKDEDSFKNISYKDFSNSDNINEDVNLMVDLDFYVTIVNNRKLD